MAEKMKKRQFDEYIIKEYLIGNLDPEQENDIRVWLSDRKGMAKWEVLRKIFCEQFKPVKRPDRETMAALRQIQRILGFRQPAPPHRRPVLQMAASVLIALILGGAVFFGLERSNDSGIIVSVPGGAQPESVTLPDGSLAVVHEGSTLTYPAAFDDARKVELSGMAVFHVIKSSAEQGHGKRFTVETDKLSVTVLGTDFCVTAYAGDNLSEVSLYNGSVNAELNGETVGMSPGEHLSYDQLTGGYTVTTINSDEMIANGGKPRLKFDNANLGEILRALEAVFEVGMEISSDVNVYGGRYSVNFERKTLEEALELLMLISNGTLSYKIEGNRVTITRNRKNISL